MDPQNTLILSSLCGGVLGWALGNLIDALLPRLKIGKSKVILAVTVVAMICALLYLRFGHL